MTPSGLRRRFCLILLAGAVAAPASGQEKPVPPPRPEGVPVDTTGTAREQPLPSIDLPEFQITGRERIDLTEFPKASADPGRGLGPPDVTPRVGDREAGPGPLDEDPRGIAPFMPHPGALHGRAVAGIGSYRTPFFDASFGNATPAAGFLLKGGYISSAGFTDNTDYRRGYAEFSSGWTALDGSFLSAGSRAEGSFGARGNSFRLYGTGTPDRQRTLSRVHLEGSLSSQAGGEFLFGGVVRMGTFGVADSERTRESWGALEGYAEREVGPVRVRGSSVLQLAAYDAPTRERNPYTAELGVTGTMGVTRDVDLSAGGTVIWFRGSTGAARMRLKPAVAVTWYPLEHLSVYAKFLPGVRRNSLELIHEENPYLLPAPDLQHRDQLVSFESGVRWEPLEGVSARLSFRHGLARHDLVFADAAPGGWTLLSGGITRRTGLDADMTARIGGRDLLGISLRLEGTRNTATGAAIPYAAAAQGTARYEHRFLFALEAGASATAVGERTVTLDGSRRLGGFVLLDLFAQYPLVPRLVLRAVVNNCTNASHRWWEGYRPVPRSVSVSLGYTW